MRYFLLNTPPKAPEFALDENPSAMRWVDSLQTAAEVDLPVYTYNPNYLSDYQGYMLGMTPQEIDRIFAHRAQGNWIKTEAEFWRVSQVIGLRRSKIAARLRFQKENSFRVASVKNQVNGEKRELKDINKVSASELREVRGIGPVLSERIIKFRNRLGGFQVMEQLYDVYGLEKEVVERVFKRYGVMEKPELHSININKASVKEIASLIYLRWEVAQRIVMFREQHGPFETFGELTKIEDFPSDKIKRISLYLSL